MIETIYVQELAFSDKERAFEAANFLLEEGYTVTMSKKEELIIINFSVTLPSIYRSE